MRESPESQLCDHILISDWPFWDGQQKACNSSTSVIINRVENAKSKSLWSQVPTSFSQGPQVAYWIIKVTHNRRTQTQGSDYLRRKKRAYTSMPWLVTLKSQSRIFLSNMMSTIANCFNFQNSEAFVSVLAKAELYSKNSLKRTFSRNANQFPGATQTKKRASLSKASRTSSMRSTQLWTSSPPNKIIKLKPCSSGSRTSATTATLSQLDLEASCFAFILINKLKWQ